MNDRASPTLRIISAETLRAKVRFGDLIEPVARAFQESSANKAQNGVVVMFPAERPELGDVYVKTGVLGGHRIYIVKVSPWFAANIANGQPQGGFLAVFDSATGHTLALLNDEHYLSDIRTAAAGAVAANLFAQPRIATAAVLGSGVQAYWQPLALYGERPFHNLLVWARSPQKAEILKHRLTEALPNVRIETSGNLEQIVRKADVLITATSSREPLVRGDWLRPGQHITAVGADDATKCELDSGVLNRSRIFVDSITENIGKGDVQRAIQSGQFAATQIAGELGEVLSGLLAGRTSDADITIAKLIGIGAQDLVAAEIALEKVATH